MKNRNCPSMIDPRCDLNRSGPRAGNGGRYSLSMVPASSRPAAPASPSPWEPSPRPDLGRLAVVFGVIAALVLAVAGLVSSAKPDNRIEQNFYGPVNAPVNTCLSADQEVELRGQVHR